MNNVSGLPNPLGKMLAGRELPNGLQVSKVSVPLGVVRSEEHTSELQSLMRISYAVFCLKKKTNKLHVHKHTQSYETQRQITMYPHITKQTTDTICIHTI